MEYIIEDASPKWFVANREQTDKFTKIPKFKGIRLIYTKDENNQDFMIRQDAFSSSTEFPEAVIDSKNDIAVIQYTGGTTGENQKEQC